MTAFQISLDRYLTSEPEDDYTPFCEQVDEFLPNHIWNFLEANAAFFQENTNDIYWKLYRKEGVTPERAAKIVARIYRERAASTDTL